MPIVNSTSETWITPYAHQHMNGESRCGAYTQWNTLTAAEKDGTKPSAAT